MATLSPWRTSYSGISAPALYLNFTVIDPLSERLVAFKMRFVSTVTILADAIVHLFGVFFVPLSVFCFERTTAFLKMVHLIRALV